ncbi:thrombospondin-4, partial [Elysia marginata]
MVSSVQPFIMIVPRPPALSFVAMGLATTKNAQALRVCSKDPRVICINTLGSYTCGDCPSGYTGKGITCEDVNECQQNPCYPGVTCINTRGSYQCASCPS